MARPSLLKLSVADERQLQEAAAESPEGNFRDACRAVLSLARGATRQQAAEHFGVHPATVGRWAARYRQRGLAGLRGPEHDGRGRPRRLQVEHLQLLRQTVLTSPRKLGYAFTAWTLPRLAEFLKRRTGVTVRAHYLGRLLHRMGIARRRPKPVLEGKRDEVAHDRAKIELESLKKHLGRRKRTVVISQDETEFHLYPYLVAIWSVVGSPQPEVRTPGKNRKRVLYGGLNLKTGHLTSHWAATKSGAHFVEYLETLLLDYPDQKILMIADNGSFHHTQRVEAYVNQNRDRLEIKWLPPYCPDLNDIERTWRRLKASHASNFLFNSLDELVANVRKGIEELNATVGSN
ncbi:MAG: IS630 family transposase [Acidobacteria bacterium]|nr:IS630 family transposase [Acidobacteriota bacterium]